VGGETVGAGAVGRETAGGARLRLPMVWACTWSVREGGGCTASGLGPI
jgi:hypothetical protein